MAVSSVPIGDHAFLSDCRSAALVTRGGSVDWLCFPRFDSPSVFARLLDEQAGYWSIAPTGTWTSDRHYVEGSLVLVTVFDTGAGKLELTDALALGEGERGHDLAMSSPHLLLRRAACIDGEVEVRVEYAPRPEYGLGTPLLGPDSDGRLVSRGGPDRLSLACSQPLHVDGGSASGTFRLRAGESLSFALQWSRAWQPAPQGYDPAGVAARLHDTVQVWRSWAEEHQRYDGPWAEQVRFSGRVLQGLTFRPTGAIVAAATTSLPESPGGSRNWDYRYAWVRDASLTLDALWVAACPDEVHWFVDWLVAAASGDLRRGKPLQIMYGVGGEHDRDTGEQLGNLPQAFSHVGLINAAWRSTRPSGNGGGNARDRTHRDRSASSSSAVTRAGRRGRSAR
jgi:GH15 family glucan-1,4-alpha-glucosidase